MPLLVHVHVQRPKVFTRSVIGIHVDDLRPEEPRLEPFSSSRRLLGFGLRVGFARGHHEYDTVCSIGTGYAHNLSTRPFDKTTVTKHD